MSHIKFPKYSLGLIKEKNNARKELQRTSRTTFKATVRMLQLEFTPSVRITLQMLGISYKKVKYNVSFPHLIANVSEKMQILYDH